MSVTAIATLLLLATPAAPGCLAVQITAVGRSAHGATPLPHSAAHRLIRALDRLPAWTQSSPLATGFRIVTLEAAQAVNMIAPRAKARVELELGGGGEPLLRELRSALGDEVEVSLAPEPCAPAAGAKATRR